MGVFNFEGVGIDKPRRSFHQSDIGSRKEGLNAALKGGNHLVFAFHRLVNVEVVGEMGESPQVALFQVVEHLRIAAQALGGDAPLVETSAAKCRGFDDDSVKPLLCCTDGSSVASGAGADDDEIGVFHMGY